MAERRKVRVLYDYPPQNEDELELVVGDIIEFLEEVEEGWWKGILKGRMGVFPSNFVGPAEGGGIKDQDAKVIPGEKDDKRKPASPKSDPQQITARTTEIVMSQDELPQNAAKPLGFSYTNGGMPAALKPKPAGFSNGKDDKKVVGKVSPKSIKPHDPDAPKLPPKPVRELAKVLYSYEAQNDDELSIKEGDTIVILTKEVEDKGWWKGELSGRVGVFPDNFVQLIRSEGDLLHSGHSSPQPALAAAAAKPDRPDKPVKALKPDLPPGDKPLMGFNPPNQPLPPLPTEGGSAAKGDQPDKPVSKVSPFGPQGMPPMMMAGGLGAKPLLASQIRKQNGAFPASLIAAQAAERANQNNSTHHANGNHEGSSASPSSLPESVAASSGLDSIESCEGSKLKHPTADRARPPARRPPSHIGSPTGHADSSIAEENGDTSGGPASAVVQLNGHAGANNGRPEESKRNSVKDTSSKFNEAGPTPQVINLAGRPPVLNGNRNSKVSLHRESLDAVDSVETDGQSAQISQKLEAELLELRAEVKRLRENCVSRDEFNTVIVQMKKLEETMETNRAHYSKMVRDLMAEVDDEKKQRMTLQVEIDRLKKITTEML